MAVATRVLTIPTVLQEMRETKLPGDRVLSAILDTSPGRTIGLAYLIAFRDAAKAIRADLERADRAEQKRFEAAIAQAEGYLNTLATPSHPGIALFASGEPSYFFVTPLPTRPTDYVSWEERPALAALESALDQGERIVTLLLDKERSRIFSIYLGEIDEQHFLFDEAPGKQSTGDWFALSQGRYLRHHEDHILRHVKRTVHALLDELRARSFDRLIIGGPDEALSLLRHQLPRPLRDRFAGTISLELFASDEDIRRASLDIAASAERAQELSDVNELLNAGSGNVVVGLDATLAALGEGRVHRLFVADTLTHEGGECESCGRVYAISGDCPVCGQPLTPLANLRERAISLASDRATKIEIVTGEAATLLLAHGGLGGWIRY